LTQFKLHPRFISNKSEIEAGLDDAINKYYGSQIGISASYNSCRPHFNIDERMLMLKSPDSKFYKRNVGSKSNYMFMHLCFFLGLHDTYISKINMTFRGQLTRCMQMIHGMIAKIIPFIFF
jgi:hypothetical protein